MEFELEEDETTQAEAEAIAERVAPRKEAKLRSERLPLPEHLKREGKMLKPDSDCCPDCGWWYCVTERQNQLLALLAISYNSREANVTLASHSSRFWLTVSRSSLSKLLEGV